MGQQIDYAKLARQHGGTPEPQPDYAQIAREVAGAPQQAPPKGVFERFMGLFGIEPNEKIQAYRGVLESGGTLEDVLKRAEEADAAQRGGGVLRAQDRNMLPAVGGVVGGMLGGAPGAALGGAAGESVRQLDNRLAGAPAPSTPMDAAKGIAAQGAIQGAATGVGNFVGSKLAAAAPRMMQSAAKPTQSVLNEYGTTAPKIVKTLLDEGVDVTEAGLSKLQTLLAATNDEIRAAVAASGGQISKKSVAARALSTADRVAKQTNPTADLKVVGETVEEFVNHPIFKGPTLSVPEAQAMKVGTYQQIGKKYGEVSSAGIETQKALARGLKEEIAAEVPAIGALNRREAELLAASEVIGRRTALAGNRDPVGFAWVTAHPVTFLTALMDRSPVVKSMLARGFYREAARAGKVTEQAIRLAVQAIVARPTTPGSEPEPDQE